MAILGSTWWSRLMDLEFWLSDNLSKVLGKMVGSKRCAPLTSYDI